MIKKLVSGLVALALLSGCSTMKRLTGQTNDAVLPGKREEILPPDQQQARDPAITGQAAPSITQDPLQGAQPSMPGAPNHKTPTAISAPQCDTRVDLCPEQVDPEAPSLAAGTPTKKVQKKKQKHKLPKISAVPVAPAPDTVIPAPPQPQAQ